MRLYTVLLSMAMTTGCFAQYSLMDVLKNSRWSSDWGSEKVYDSEAVDSSKSISLYKKYDNDPKTGMSIWTFADLLTIQSIGRGDTIISTYRYILNSKKRTLKIILAEQNNVTFSIGLPNLKDAPLTNERISILVLTKVPHAGTTAHPARP